MSVRPVSCYYYLSHVGVYSEGWEAALNVVVEYLIIRYCLSVVSGYYDSAVVRDLADLVAED